MSTAAHTFADLMSTARHLRGSTAMTPVLGGRDRGTTTIPRPQINRAPPPGPGGSARTAPPAAAAPPSRPVAPPSGAQMPTLGELDAKYKNFRDHFGIYEQAIKAYLMIGRMFQSYDTVVTRTDAGTLGRRSVAQSPNNFQNDHNISWFDVCPQLGATNAAFTHLEVNAKDGYVETRVQMDDIPIHLGFGSRARNNSTQFLNMTHGQVLDRFTKMMRRFFPDFSIPTRIRKVEVESKNKYSRTKDSAWQVADAFEPLKTLVTLTGLEKINEPFTPDAVNPEKAAKRFVMPADYKDKYCTTVQGKTVPVVRTFVELEINPDSFQVFDMDVALYSQRVPTNTEIDLDNNPDDAASSIAFRVRSQLVFRWPLEFAMYVTSAGSPNDFIPFMFKQYEAWHRSAYSVAKRKRTAKKKTGPEAKTAVTADQTTYSKSDLPDRVSHLGRIVETVEQRRRQGSLVKPRTNADDFTILGSAEPAWAGEVLWVPKGEDKVGELLEQMRRSHNPQENQIDASAFSIRDTGVYSDWLFEKFTYMRRAGVGFSASDIIGLQTFDLTGSIPLDSTTVVKELRARLLEDVEVAGAGKKLYDEFFFTVKKFVAGSDSAPPAQDYLNRNFWAQNEALKPLEAYFSRTGDRPTPELFLEMVRFLANVGLEVRWGNLGGMPFYQFDDKMMALDGTKRTFVNALRPMGADEMEKLREDMQGATIKLDAALASLKLLQMICEDMWRQFDRIDVAYGTKVHWLRFRLALITKYAKSPEPHERAALDKQQRITDVDKYDTRIDNIRLPNMPGIKNLMPHQAAVWNVLDQAPDAALVGVAPGGGKTLISMRDAMNLIMANKGRRVLVVVPNRLVRSWVNETLSYSRRQINPIPITSLSYDVMNDALYPDYQGTFNRDLLRRLVSTAPVNSIFITDFTFLRSKTEDVLYGARQVRTFPVAQFFRDMEFDIVMVDESHFAKNIASNQTAAVSVITSTAKFLRELSGTIVTDIMTDLVGQVGLANPAALGNKSDFLNQFAESTRGGTVSMWKPEAHMRIAREMTPYIQHIDIKRYRFAYALPDMIEDFHPVGMTPRQQLFYNKWVDDKLKEIENDDPDLASKMRSGNEQNSEEIAAKLARYFALVEQFVYAPDSVPAFRDMFGDSLTPEDLVSPKIAKIVELLDQHFDGYIEKDTRNKIDASPYKVIIFSHRKPTSEHVIRNLPPKYRAQAVRYTAGNEDALDSFYNNPKVRILIADELSINMGQNMQAASRLIRLETLWSPGSQDQAISRIFRPDNLNSDDLDAGSLRPLVNIDWIYTNQSLEVAKIGRIVSKMIDKFRFDRLGDPDFTKERFKPGDWWYQSFGNHVGFPHEGAVLQTTLESLPLIVMNFETIAEMNQAAYLMPYFGTYALMQEFERLQFEREKASGNQKSIRLPAEAHVQIPGSKTLAYLPRVPGVKPEAFDPEGTMGYKPLSFLKNEEDSDDDAVVYNRGDTFETEYGPGKITKVLNDKLEVEINGLGLIVVDKPSSKYEDNKEVGVSEDGTTLVDTEFGFGYVRKLQKEHVKVDVPGLGLVRVPKATTWVITQPEAANRVRHLLRQAGRKGLPRLIGQIEGESPVQQATRVKTNPAIEDRNGSVRLAPLSPRARPPVGPAPIPDRLPRIGKAGLPPIAGPVRSPYPAAPTEVDDGFETGTGPDVGEEDIDFGFGDDEAPALPPAAPVSEAPGRPRARLAPPPGPDRNADQVRSPVVQPFFDTEDDVASNSQISMHAVLVDGQVGLCALAADADSELLVDDFQFKAFPNYASVRFPFNRPELLTKFVAQISRVFRVGPQFIDNLNTYVELLHRRRLNTANPADFADTMRFVAVDAHRPAPEGQIRPYPVVWNDNLFVCVPHPSDATMAKLEQIGHSLMLPGPNPVALQQNINLRLFRSREAAATVLAAVGRMVHVTNADAVIAALRKMKTGGPRVSETEGQPSLVSPRAAPIRHGQPAPGAPRPPAPRGVVQVQPRTHAPTVPAPLRPVPAPTARTAPVPARTPKPRPLPTFQLGDEDVDFGDILGTRPIAPPRGRR